MEAKIPRTCKPNAEIQTAFESRTVPDSQGQSVLIKIEEEQFVKEFANQSDCYANRELIKQEHCVPTVPTVPSMGENAPFEEVLVEEIKAELSGMVDESIADPLSEQISMDTHVGLPNGVSVGLFPAEGTTWTHDNSGLKNRTPSESIPQEENYLRISAVHSLRTRGKNQSDAEPYRDASPTKTPKRLAEMPMVTSIPSLSMIRTKDNTVKTTPIFNITWPTFFKPTTPTEQTGVGSFRKIVLRQPTFSIIPDDVTVRTTPDTAATPTTSCAPGESKNQPLPTTSEIDHAGPARQSHICEDPLADTWADRFRRYRDEKEALLHYLSCNAAVDPLESTSESGDVRESGYQASLTDSSVNALEPPCVLVVVDNRKLRVTDSSTDRVVFYRIRRKSSLSQPIPGATTDLTATLSITTTGSLESPTDSAIIAASDSEEAPVSQTCSENPSREHTRRHRELVKARQLTENGDTLPPEIPAESAHRAHLSKVRNRALLSQRTTSAIPAADEAQKTAANHVGPYRLRARVSPKQTPSAISNASAIPAVSASTCSVATESRTQESPTAHSFDTAGAANESSFSGGKTTYQRRPPMTSAERVRRHRGRMKALRLLQNISSCTSTAIADAEATLLRSFAAQERVRDRPPPMTSAERVRRHRARMKALRLHQSTSSSATTVTPDATATPPTSLPDQDLGHERPPRMTSAEHVRQNRDLMRACLQPNVSSCTSAGAMASPPGSELAQELGREGRPRKTKELLCEQDISIACTPTNHDAATFPDVTTTLLKKEAQYGEPATKQNLEKLELPTGATVEHRQVKKEVDRADNSVSVKDEPHESGDFGFMDEEVPHEEISIKEERRDLPGTRNDSYSDTDEETYSDTGGESDVHPIDTQSRNTGGFEEKATETKGKDDAPLGFSQRDDESTPHSLTANESIKCSICGKTFATVHNLATHMRAHTLRQPFQCSECEQRFYLEEELKYHSQIHSDSLECSKCGKTYLKRHNLVVHMWSHMDKDSVRCGSCGKLFFQITRFRMHILRHSDADNLFQCTKCERRFAKLGFLRNHKKTHALDTPFSCKLCNQVFAEESRLLYHMRTHREKGRFKCTICSKQFFLKAHVAFHMRRHLAENPFKCSECDARFSAKSMLTEHMATHAGANGFQCSLCNRKYFRQPHITDHMRIHTESEPFHCGVCSQRFAEKFDLTEHVGIHREKKGLQCQECSQVFSCATSLSEHMRTHPATVHIWCSMCSRKFAKKAFFVEHMLMHSEKEPFHCSQCGKRFSEKCLLANHVQFHINEYPVQCLQCEERFLKEADLSDHMKIHVVDEPFLCKNCGLGFTDESQLKDHVKTHLVEESFYCSECNRRFTKRALLTTHMKVHEKDKPFHCIECNERFTEKSILTEHTKKFHDLENPFPCEVCNRRFSREDMMRTHMNVHTTIKPHHCGECNERFTSEYRLEGHMKSHNLENPFPCKLCNRRFTTKRILELHIVNRHPEKKKFPCRECNQRFISKSWLNRHVNQRHKRHNVILNPFFCDEPHCTERFSNQETLDNHARIHKGKKPFPCSECCKQFFSKSGLMQHVKAHHGKSFRCSQCDHCYTEEAQLADHMQSHLAKEPIHCSICNHRVFSLSELTDHVTQVHELAVDTVNT